ncbi:Hint domain-containing protein [Phaeobacter sp. B1627]|uniref:Hint domain-containing protein n=1 Tax=Phaeobacter sp. B1627 TaxID=2583809 RepID=UPI00111AB9C9|nr:Hint domain-containing protein [Phaeobacter sp. B1627]TNJ38901.1 hypothetical protein FGE21_19360 [Phaeobacter sp. B1627]
MSTYSNDVFLVGTLYGQSAVSVSQILSGAGANVSSTALLGAVLNEYNARLNDPAVQNAADWYSSYRLPTHQEIIENYNEVAALSPTEQLAIGKLGKLTSYPVMIDLGPGNVQLFTAIGLLNDYKARYPNSDPLNLKSYENDYSALAADLTDTFSDTTVKFAGLMVQKGTEWGSNNVANWNDLSQAEKNAFAVFFYKVGENEMNARLESAGGNYVPDLAGAPIAQEFYSNIEGIDSAVVNSFGSWWSNALGSEQGFAEAQKLEYYADFFEQNPEAFSTNPMFLNHLISEVGHDGLRQLANVFDWPLCFAEGTLISLGDGTQIPIEDVRIGDVVTSYESTLPLGRLQNKRVTRLFKNEVAHLLDVHGLKVTPGHVTLCGDGQFAGKHVPIIDILLSDGALVRENGDLIRMAINKPVGSREDQFVQVSYAVDADAAREGNLQSGKMRVGTLLFDRDDQPVSVLDCIQAEGMTFNPKTGLVTRAGGSPEPLYFFGELPRPEDYILRRSRETLEGILTDGEWEGTPSQLVGQRLRQTYSLKLH